MLQAKWANVQLTKGELPDSEQDRNTKQTVNYTNHTPMLWILLLTSVSLPLLWLYPIIICGWMICAAPFGGHHPFLHLTVAPHGQLGWFIVLHLTVVRGATWESPSFWVGAQQKPHLFDFILGILNLFIDPWHHLLTKKTEGRRGVPTRFLFGYVWKWVWLPIMAILSRRMTMINQWMIS